MRKATRQEKAWWERFEALMAAMPPSVEVIIHNSRTITLHERGAHLAHFDATGNADNVPELTGVNPVQAYGVIPNSEDL